MMMMIIATNSDQEAWSIPFPGHDDSGDNQDNYDNFDNDNHENVDGDNDYNSQL